MTRLYTARESSWWVQAAGVPVALAGGFEVVDVVLRSATAAMAVQCLRMSRPPTLRFDRPASTRPPAGNLFTVAEELISSARGTSHVRECPALLDAAARALRGATGLAELRSSRAAGADPRREPPPSVVPAVLTMARLVTDVRSLRERGIGPLPSAEAARERLWVWFLTQATAATARHQERRRVAIVTWTGLRHFLSVAAPGCHTERSFQAPR